jgi:ribosomal protein S18 acetylase RimI-like enzyme
LYQENENLFYELRTTEVQPDVPSGWLVVVVASERDASTSLLLQSGGQRELPFLNRRAVAYLMCIGDEVVGRLWHFRRNSLAQWLGPDTAYVGRIFVKPEMRGQQIAGRLLASMAAHLPVGSRVILEVEPSNVSSQKCLVKAGCVLLGRIRTTECFTRLIRVRINGQAPTGNPDT